MKGTRDIVSTNIVEGKRKRVMSTEAVKSLVTQEITDTILRQHRNNIIQNEKINTKQENEKINKSGIKKKKIDQKLDHCVSKDKQERSGKMSKIVRVPITKKSLEKLIDQYFYIVTSSESESEVSSNSSSQEKINRITPKKQKFSMNKKDKKKKVSCENETPNRLKQINPLNQPKLKQVIQIKQNVKSSYQKNIKIPHKLVKHYEEDCIPSVQNLISQIESTE